MSLPRYAPGRAFPPYAFLPGRAPHPRRDPAGHSFERPEEPADYLPAERWRDNREFLWGVDLFNHGYPWEAHEAWEAVWNASRDRGDAFQAGLVQGLILCAAAVVKGKLGETHSVARLAERALAMLAEAAALDARAMGIDVAELVRGIERYASAGGFGEPPVLSLA